MSDLALGYVRVSTRHQDLSPQAQAERLEHRAAERGLRLELIEERVSARSARNRPELQACLRRLAAGEAVALLTDKLDRVARNLRDFLELDDLASRQGWALVVLNLDFDSSTATGRLIRSVMAAIAEWERQMIGERTAEALTAKRSSEPDWRPGRPVQLNQAVREYVAFQRTNGLSHADIAAALNVAGIPSVSGRPWSAGMVASVTRSLRHDPHTTRDLEPHTTRDLESTPEWTLS